MDFVALPKIELHAHLTGSISRQTLHEIWLAKSAAGETDLQDPLLVMPEGKHDFNLETFFPLFSKYIYALLTDATSLRHATASVLQSFLRDGVVYLELRTTPRATPHLSAEQYVSVIVDAISAFEASNPSLHTRLILSVDRRDDLEKAESTLSIALSSLSNNNNNNNNRTSSSSLPESIIVGLDLCGDPTARPNGAISVFTPVFTRARAAGLGITLHFAETPASASPAELAALLSWRPHRLGHVIWDDADSKREIARRKGELCLELCLSCNVHAGMVQGGFEGHHFGGWRAVEGVKVTLGTDDVGIFGSPLSNEYRLVAQHFRLDKAQVCALARESIDAIFGGDKEKERLRSIMWT
ncbi:Metallo-dependent hydrolase [Trichoderma citrinoviride]|uniref:Metallo-dependent hydrolase n=1 Tax=Trichoderma citrinoviride TaxID=58853 RepID=A0A2T4B7G9_9HYPO|nr:Metallo-dependent hydrolase [Trichoderma citrinoviride]PTB65161.1 Metallo-dependent hydrolase [Trichoderma citrinoviride]